MKEIDEILKGDYEKVNEQISVVDINSDQHEKLLDERDKIRNEMIKLKQAEMEIEMRKDQVEAENKREKIRNGINIGTFVVSTCVGIYTVIKTFRFDQDSTVTSTLGRTTLTSVVSKIFKR